MIRTRGLSWVLYLEIHSGFVLKILPFKDKQQGQSWMAKVLMLIL